MSSFFTVPGSHKKRKRSSAPEAPQKRVAGSKTPGKVLPKANGPAKKKVERDESISGSDSEDDESRSEAEESGDAMEADESDEEAETAAERRLRLAERYLENVKEHVDEAGFDAADIDRDLIAERLQEDVAESKGRVYRQLAVELAFNNASQTLFRSNTNSITSIATCAPYFYTTSKDIHLHKWKTQELPQHQYPQTTRKKQKKPPAPPRRQPDLELWIKGNSGKAKDRSYLRHTDQILAVAASSDGKYVVTGGQDRRIIVYDAATLKPLKVLTDLKNAHHRDAVTGLAFRRGTNQLYSCSKDRTVKVWSLDEMAYVDTLCGHQDEILDIDALAQERCVSVGARDRTARLWKVIESTQLVYRGGGADKKPRPGIDQRSLLHEGSMDRIAMIDDDLFVTGSDNGAIALWSTQKKKPVYIEPIAHGLDPPLKPSEVSAELHPKADVPPPTPRMITALKAIPYSDVILSGSWDGQIRVWRLSDDKRRIELIAALGVIPGVINDIDIFERGERGQDGLCIIAAFGKDHRLGRWKTLEKVKNGGVIFEIPKVARTTKGGSSEHISTSDEEDD
ncbi:WD40-repeat-containing domain protein [Stachybotrys elegans]|uniref:WD40-repeat-containing domain protein n=1 Tax=Stachybotrys elegans TaxID=80388 RepID=A0A8K0SRV0_9HYPO|nr:WD40-repeat-containing domain protein [Stachybotrys elegans]